MLIKQLIDEDFVNYKFPSMYVGLPYCNFKCEKECGLQVCQNSLLATSQSIDIDVDLIANRYVNNNITKSIVLAGLEPFDSFSDIHTLILTLRKQSDDDVVIFTGYNKNEIENEVILLSEYKNIVIKFGRYVPNQESHYDDVLGINLASDNQYAERIS